MTDLSALGIFLVCLAATVGLVHACSRLRPREIARPGLTPLENKEVRP